MKNLTGTHREYDTLTAAKGEATRYAKATGLAAVVRPGPGPLFYRVTYTRGGKRPPTPRECFYSAGYATNVDRPNWNPWSR